MLSSAMVASATVDGRYMGSFQFESGIEAGQPLVYSNWAMQQPANLGSQQCIALNRFGTWETYDCSLSLSFLVEYECDPGFILTDLGCTGLH